MNMGMQTTKRRQISMHRKPSRIISNGENETTPTMQNMMERGMRIRLPNLRSTMRTEMKLLTINLIMTGNQRPR